jgi:hypothetical protein
MTNRGTMMAALASAGAVAMLAAASQARPIYMKYDDIKGEVSEAAGHDKWIEVESVSMPVHRPAAQTPEVVASPGAGTRARSGVSVAAGDVTGDGRADAPTGPRGLAARGPNPVPVGLLLPAVQKVREAAARMPAGETCRVGPLKGPLSIRESESGATGRILDAAVSACAGETVTITFSKIEWD